MAIYSWRTYSLWNDWTWPFIVDLLIKLVISQFGKLLISVNLPGYTDVHRCVIAKLDDRCVFVWVFPGTHQQLKLLKWLGEIQENISLTG